MKRASDQIECPSRRFLRIIAAQTKLVSAETYLCAPGFGCVTADGDAFKSACAVANRTAIPARLLSCDDSQILAAVVKRDAVLVVNDFALLGFHNQAVHAPYGASRVNAVAVLLRAPRSCVDPILVLRVYREIEAVDFDRSGF
jgi:hypothetical protein